MAMILGATRRHWQGGRSCNEDYGEGQIIATVRAPQPRVLGISAGGEDYALQWEVYPKYWRETENGCDRTDHRLEMWRCQQGAYRFLAVIADIAAHVARILQLLWELTTCMLFDIPP